MILPWARGVRDKYPKFTDAMARRNWKWAGVKHRRDRPADRADIVQAWFNQAGRLELGGEPERPALELRLIVHRRGGWLADDGDHGP